MASLGSLHGVTVLDLSTVGPGTRCTRILADYGARVVKVGAPPRRAGVQVEPHHWAYSARRGFEQVRIDLKAAEGRQGKSGAGRPDASDDLLGWQPMLLNQARPCSDCGEEIRAGRKAFLGITSSGGSDTVLCRRCPEAR